MNRILVQISLLCCLASKAYSEQLELDIVSVSGHDSKAAKENSSFTFTDLDTEDFKNQSKDLAQVLNGIPGVVVRMNGGLGSSYDFSLNGLSGTQIRFFINGIPMENYGSSLGLNNFPINLIERIEIYKGVVPISLAGDALGGAVNLITPQSTDEYTDISYSFGSFNTHRLSAETQVQLKGSAYVKASTYINYSDNNYTVDGIAVTDDLGNKLGETSYERFHDTYQSAMANVEVGVTNSLYADKASLSFLASQSEDEVQHPESTMNRAFGDYYTTSAAGFLSPLWEKSYGNHYFKGLAQIGRSVARYYDTSDKTYNWDGTYTLDTSGSAEYRDEKSILKVTDDIKNASLFYNYDINNLQRLSINISLNSLTRSGEDRLNPENDLFRNPNKVNKYIAAVNLSNLSPSTGIKSDVFVKQYSYEGDVISEEIVDGQDSIIRTLIDNDNLGYGFALSKSMDENKKLRLTYEHSYRFPTADEQLGDGQFVRANPDLEPESSDNINISYDYSISINDWYNEFSANIFYRDAKDFIKYEADRIVSGIYLNKSQVLVNGIEGAFKTIWDNSISFDFNLTYQDIRDRSKTSVLGGVNSNYNGRLENTPYLFSKIGLSSSHNYMNNPINVSWSTNFVYEHYLSPEEYGNSDSKNIIPTQIYHDLDIAYSMQYGKYNIGFTVSNLTDKTIYDSFSIQKPGRAYYLKLRYTY